jgi:hypothetical protein
MMAQKKPELKIGGAFTFQLQFIFMERRPEKRGGDFGYDMFRINAEAAYKGIFLECRIQIVF